MGDRYTAAINAGDAKVVAECLEGGSDVNFKLPDGYSALMTAAYFNHIQVFEALLVAGADFNEIVEWGFVSNALLVAADRGNLEIVNMLLERECKIESTDQNGKTALFLAATNGFELVVRGLIQHGADIHAEDKEGYTALMHASWYGGGGAVKAIIEGGGRVNDINLAGETALMKACCNGHTDIAMALIAAGADIHIAAQDGSTAFMDAASQGKVDIVTLLLDKGADINTQESKYGRTALMKSVMHGNSSIMQLLCTRGADVNLVDKYDLSALRAAAQTDRRWAVEALTEAGAAVDAADKNGLTALIIAAQNGYSQALQALLIAGANIDLKDKSGRTALDHAKKGFTMDLLQSAIFDRAANRAANEADALKAKAAAELETCIRALSPELYGEFILLSHLPRQVLEEEILGAMALAKAERRLKDLKALKEQRESSVYTPPGPSAEQMRARLVALKDRLTSRIDELMDADDDDGCIICDEYKTTVQNVLDMNTPLVTASAKIASLSSASPPLPRVAGPGDVVELLSSISEGGNSSGKSVLVIGLFTAAHTTERLPVMAKIFDKSHFSRAQKEYCMMAKLHKADASHFVRPFAFLDGATGHIIPLQSEDLVVCASSICIVMEKGAVDLKEYFANRSDIQVTEKLSVVRHLLDILRAAHRCGVVLNDFKAANVVRVSDGRYDFNLKAIDFDSSREEGEAMSDEITAGYTSPEVARTVLARARGDSQSSPPSSHKTDVMALGWTVYEIANNMESYWSNQAHPPIGDIAILTAIANLKDEDVHKDIEETFPGDQFASLRTWLIHALRVNPKERATAEELLHSHSLFGSKDRTLDPNNLMSKISLKMNQCTDKVLDKGDQILHRIDDLSDQLDKSFSLFGVTLDNVAASMALGSEQNCDSMAALSRALDEQRRLLEVKKILDPHEFENSIAAAISSMDLSVRESITTSIQSVMSTSTSSLTSSDSDPSHGEKLDALLALVQGLHTQSALLSSDFEEFSKLSRQQLELLTILEMNDNAMPTTFVILPSIEVRDKTLASSKISMMGRMMRAARRTKNQVLDLVWARSRVVFICPVTLEQVPCGPDGHGYEFKIPTDMVASLLPALKWGLLFLKIALATQGLGGVVPNLDFLTDIDATMLDTMAAQMSSVAAKASEYADQAATAAGTALDTVQHNQEQAKNAFSQVYAFIKDAEKGGLHWKPLLTGLVLTPAPAGKGRSAWVSPAGAQRFSEEGCDAIRNITTWNIDSSIPIPPAL